MESDIDGFLYPNAFNPGECIDCKRCLKICPLKSNYKGDAASGHYAGFDRNESNIKRSASGGLATAISKTFIETGGIVYGVRYSDDFYKVEYTRCDDIQSLSALKGSKYAQASKENIYKSIQKDLKSHKVLYFALPCEVHALKLFIGDNDNLYTAALICHGPTSPLVQKEYAQNLERQFGSKIIDFTLRYKVNGVKPYYIKADFSDGSSYKEQFHPSTYGIAFKELKRPSCSVCRFKLKYDVSHIDADIILGDYHGMTVGQQAYNKWGSSQVSVLTEKGQELLKAIDKNFNLYQISARQAIHYNKALDRIIKPRWNRNQFAKELGKYGLEAACKLQSIKFIDCYQGIINKIRCTLAIAKRKILK